jgi:hypothetical protein
MEPVGVIDTRTFTPDTANSGSVSSDGVHDGKRSIKPTGAVHGP